MEQIIASTDAESKAPCPAPSAVDDQLVIEQGQAGRPHCADPLDRVDLYRQRYEEARQYLKWFGPAWEVLADDERFILEAFFLGGNHEDAILAVRNRFRVERATAYAKKSRALSRLATALFGSR